MRGMIDMKKSNAIMINEKDNVATMLDKVEKNDMVIIKGNNQKIKALNNISFGHKIALTNIKEEEQIIKYGAVIAEAGKNITKGEHIHVHNAKEK